MSPTWTSLNEMSARTRTVFFFRAMSTPQQQLDIRIMTVILPPIQFPSTPNGR